MPRTVSLAAMRSALAQHTDKVWVCLLEVSHANFSTIRLCDNTENVSHQPAGDVNTYVYQAFPFRAILPSDEADREPNVQLVVSNVDRSLVDEVRSMLTPPAVRLKVVLSDTPNTVEYGPVDMKATSVAIDANSLTFTLVFDSYSSEPIPWLTFTPEYFPGMFGLQ